MAGLFFVKNVPILFFNTPRFEPQVPNIGTRTKTGGNKQIFTENKQIKWKKLKLRFKQRED
jgi:hypothetical protein